MATSRTTADNDVRRIVALLESEYLPDHPRAEIHARRYNEACIWIRIIDPDYTGIRMEARWDRLWKLCGALSNEVHAQISLLFLLTPSEAERRFRHMNAEFADPHFDPEDPGGPALKARRRRQHVTGAARKNGGKSR